jgi:hypothetical protein
MDKIINGSCLTHRTVEYSGSSLAEILAELSADLVRNQHSLVEVNLGLYLTRTGTVLLHHVPNGVIIDAPAAPVVSDGHPERELRDKRRDSIASGEDGYSQYFAEKAANRMEGAVSDGRPEDVKSSEITRTKARQEALEILRDFPDEKARRAEIDRRRAPALVLLEIMNAEMEARVRPSLRTLGDTPPVPEAAAAVDSADATAPTAAPAGKEDMDAILRRISRENAEAADGSQIPRRPLT